MQESLLVPVQFQLEVMERIEAATKSKPLGLEAQIFFELAPVIIIFESVIKWLPTKQACESY